MKHRLTRVAATVAVLFVAAPAAAHAAANETDRAFVREMIPDHLMATEMAEMAKTDGEHKKIRRSPRGSSLLRPRRSGRFARSRRASA